MLKQCKMYLFFMGAAAPGGSIELASESASLGISSGSVSGSSSSSGSTGSTG